jgi:hypothetical protein
MFLMAAGMAMDALSSLQKLTQPSSPSGTSNSSAAQTPFSLGKPGISMAGPSPTGTSGNGMSASNMSTLFSAQSQTGSDANEGGTSTATASHALANKTLEQMLQNQAFAAPAGQSVSMNV